MIEAAHAPGTAAAPPRWAGGPARRLLRLWRGGAAPDLDAFLLDEAGLSPRELAAVLRADQGERWRRGERVPAESYLARFTAVADDPDLALDLVYGEFLLRESLGEPAPLDDYPARFPRFAETFGVQVAFHKALQGDATHPPADATRPTTAPKLPGYQILGELGTGGMGVVYEAVQTGLDRRVALKLARPEAQGDPDQLERFRAEAESSARLHHPNIVEIYETGEFRGRPYFSQEVVEGGTLALALEAGPFSARRAALITEALARAMHYAHREGVVHRDLKPGNILLTREGTPKVADFGLAKRLWKDSDETQSGAILGSPSYMSPEQARGRVHEIGPAADVYSLGAILYEMITGAPPFRAENPLDTLRALLADEPVRPSRLRPNLPRDLETVCLKCLEKSPGGRYASAGELAEDLERFLNHEPVRARPLAAAERAWRWCLRKQSLAIALGLAAAAVLATIAISVSFAVHQYKAATRLGVAIRDVETHRRQVNQLAAQLAYEHGHRLCEQGDAGHGMLWLVRGLNSAGQARDGALERAFRRDLGAWGDRLHPLSLRVEHPGLVRSMAFSPDGRTLALAGDDHTVRVRDAATGDPVGPPLVHDKAVHAVAFSPDGKTLLTGCDDGKAELWDLATMDRTGPTLTHDKTVYAVAFSPDGHTVLTGSFDHTARLWDARTGAPVGRPMEHEWNVVAVAFSPDGKAAMTGSWDKTARVWDARTGEPLLDPIAHDDWVSSVAFSPDGKTVLTGCYDRAARFFDRATGRRVGPKLSHQHCVCAVAYSPDGESVLVGCHDGTARLWDAATGQPEGSLLRHRHTISSVAFSPDGRAVATGSYDRTALLWKVAPAAAGRTIRHDGFIRGVLFSPDGKTILSASKDHTARLWDAKTGLPVGPPLVHDDAVECLAFSPDGRLALTGSADKTARLWDAATGAPVGRPLENSAPVLAVAFAPDGRTAFAGGEDGSGSLWDVATCREVGAPLTHGQAVRAVAFHPDGRTFLTGSDDATARLWDAHTGSPLGRPFEHSGPVTAVAFSPDGSTILTGCEDMTARLWNPATGGLRLPPLQHQGPVSVAAFSPDGATVITGGWDRVARLWETTTGRPVAPPLRHDGKLRALAISPDGRSVLTGSYDRNAQLWDKATGKPIGPAFRHESQVWFVVFSPDGRTVLSGGQQNGAHFWSVPTSRDDPADAVELDLHVATGMALDAEGGLRFLEHAEWNSLRDRLARPAR